MKYYPLEAIEKSEKTEDLIQALIRGGYCSSDTTKEDIHDYVFSTMFFNPEYKGKFEKLNNTIMYDKELNRIFVPMYSMEKVKERSTEWKDVLTTSLVLSIWEKSKMVYKVDNDFFHEIKQTQNLTITKEMLDNLPFNCFFVDFTEVEDISNFKGAWVYVVKYDKQLYEINIYLIQGTEFVIFSYYSLLCFGEEGGEVEWNPKNLQNTSYVYRDNVMELPRIAEGRDPRSELVIAVHQIMSFISIDASDVSENPTTKYTYKPRTTVKNKFSEVRMWDVGVRYGKAIRVAKREYKKHIEKNNNSKERKATRPHIRRAHWHKYRIGEGRKKVKTVWLAPTYVCGNGKEIPVTIREIKK